MGCITSGMVQTSPGSTKNKVEPVILRTDKVSRGVARDQRQQDIAKHHSEAFNKAKSLSDRVLAEKETLSTTSTVRSSWSRGTAPNTRRSSPTNDGQNGNISTNPTNSNGKLDKCLTKNVHFDANNSDSGHFSDIPGLLPDTNVTMVTKRAPTPIHPKKGTNDVDITTTESSHDGNGTRSDNECTQADEAECIDTKRLSDEPQHSHQQGDSNNCMSPDVAAGEQQSENQQPSEEIESDEANCIDAKQLSEKQTNPQGQSENTSSSAAMVTSVEDASDNTKSPAGSEETKQGGENDTNGNTQGGDNAPLRSSSTEITKGDVTENKEDLGDGL